MDEVIVRIKSIEINNIKNTNHGFVELPFAASNLSFVRSSEILGIYGQNGSGKTAVIETLFFIQKILQGERLPGDLACYINQGYNHAEIQVEFTVEKGELKFEAGYYIKLLRTDHGSVEIGKELVSSSKIESGKRRNRLVCVEYRAEDHDCVFLPRARYEELTSSRREDRLNLLVAKRLAKVNGCSYIFGEASRVILERANDEKFGDSAFLISCLHRYACRDLFVIRSSHSGAISADFVLPLAFRAGTKHFVEKGDLLVAMREPTVLNDRYFALLNQIIEGTNIVLGEIIPGMQMAVQDYGSQMLKDGGSGRRIELVSQRGEVRIPIRYESEGIIKIISILNVLIKAYHDPSICIAVDELDAGIYEYLLGEILDIYSRGAKGQLIFTSHNLRPLEMLDKNSIIFSTSNPDRRFIRMQSIKQNNNLRDVYLRCITLGGQKECIYSETDSLRISRAFRNAGKRMSEDE